MTNKRRKFSSDFKAKVVLEALKERETLESLAKNCKAIMNTILSQ